MVSVLHLLSYVGGLAGFLFVTLSLASGLLWLAELIEEHSRYAKTVGMRAIYSIITLHIILYFTDSLPFLPTLFSIFCHLVYLQNFSSSWPYISLTSLKFIASCLLVVADHFTWFFHFAQRAQEQKKYRGPKYRYGGSSSALSRTGYGSGEETFMDVAAFFGICVWFVPLFLFLSLSANDNALPSLHPSAAPSPAAGANQTVDLASPAVESALHRAAYRPKVSLVKSILTPVINYLPHLGSKKKYGQDPEGIIAPRTPVRGSPLHTPVNLPMPETYFPWNGNGSGETTSSTPSSSRSGSGSLGRASGSGSGTGIGIGLGRPGGRTPPPPRRVQSEMMTTGLNPRGIATRNGVAAVPDSMLPASASASGSGVMTDEPIPDSIRRTGLGVAGRSIPRRPESPSMSLGPERGVRLGGAEIIETKGQAQPKRKDD